MKADELIPGQIYVTRGGLVTLKNDPDRVPQPWGYDRVKFIKIEKNKVLVETPWGSICDLPIEYEFASTIENCMRCEFPLRGVYAERTVIPFQEALAKGICKEIVKSEEEIKAEKAAREQEAEPSSKSHKQTKKHKTQATERSKNDAQDEIISFFSDFHTIAEGMEKFSCKYQKIYFLLKAVKEKGHAGQDFVLQKDDTNKGSTKFKLVRV